MSWETKLKEKNFGHKRLIEDEQKVLSRDCSGRAPPKGRERVGMKGQTYKEESRGFRGHEEVVSDTNRLVQEREKPGNRK